MNSSRRRVNYIGKTAKVRSGLGGYDLPAGLPEGATVKIVGFDIGSFDVEHEGRRFKISMTCVENLHQLWTNRRTGSVRLQSKKPPGDPGG